MAAFLIWAYKTEYEEGQAIWAEPLWIHERGSLRLFSPVMLDFCFQCVFLHISVIKEGKRRGAQRVTLPLLFLWEARGKGRHCTTHGGTCPYRGIWVGSDGTDSAVPKPCGTCSLCDAVGECSLSLELLLGIYGWHRSLSSVSLEDTIPVRQPGARVSVTQAQLCTRKIVVKMFWICLDIYLTCFSQ